MSSDRDDRVDMLDLLINLLKEHEKTMDELTFRLETLLDEDRPPTEPPRRTPERISGLIARVSSWREFKRQCTGALSAAVEIDERIFKATALTRNILFAYEEEIPVLEVTQRDGGRETTYSVSDASLTLKSLMGTLDCGLELDRRVIDSALPDGGRVQRVVYYVDPGTARSWLAEQLALEEASIILGALSLREDLDE
ncbi:hypothetical protein HQ586_06635 [Candidatus Bathyarchaeota archaeon]|nr:hypothetical protein [Candidatus Bathyarchaeota archaeon]